MPEQNISETYKIIISITHNKLVLSGLAYSSSTTFTFLKDVVFPFLSSRYFYKSIRMDLYLGAYRHPRHTSMFNDLPGTFEL